jgi:hypothetical protein
MPDIKTALEKALSQTANAWAADDEAHQQTEPQQEKAMQETLEKTDGRLKSNVSRATFYFIRDNAGLTAAQATVALVEQGHKAVSVGLLINQMVNTRMLMVDEQGRLSAVIREYIPIQSKAMRAATKKPKAKPTPRPELHKHKQVTLVNTRTGEVLNPKPADEPLALPTLPTADSVLANMSVGEAFRLYTRLKTMFGGVA